MSTKTLPFLFLLLSSTAVALNSYSYYSLNGSDANFNNLWLGNLTSGDVISFFLEFPNPETGVAPTSFVIILLDSTKTQFFLQPSGFGSNKTTPINAQGSSTYRWDVSATGVYYVRIESVSSSASFVPYRLTVTNSNGSQILKIVDAVRIYYLSLMYLASPQMTYTIWKPFGTVTLNYIEPNGTWTRISPISTNSSASNYFNLTAGSYVIQTFFSSGGVLTFQSDSFLCPSYYDSNFSDSALVYQTCTFPVTSTPTTTSEVDDNYTRNIALITIFSFVGLIGLVILMVFIAKKISAAGASSAVATNETSQVNIQNVNSSSNPRTAQFNNEPILKE